MFVSLFRKALLYIKEVQEVGLFALMSNSQLFFALSESPLFYISLPFLGLISTLLALIKGYDLAKAHNKNFDKWFDFIVSVTCALLSSVALYGTSLSILYNFTFAAGPWFFLSSVVIAFTHQLVLLGLNLYRIFEALPRSDQRMHYIQALINNLFVLGALSAVLGSVFCVMLFPTAVGSVFALTAVAFTLANILWQLTPHNCKLFIKELLCLGKPTDSSKRFSSITPENNVAPDLSKQAIMLSPRLFTQYDYSAEVRAMNSRAGDIYLQDILNRKIDTLQNNAGSVKNNQKAGLLTKISLALSSHEAMESKAELFKQYPQAFQNFWAEKGEVEQLFDAVLIQLDKYKKEDDATLDLADNLGLSKCSF